MESESINTETSIGRQELAGMPLREIEVFVQAYDPGGDEKKNKLRSRQLYHWIYVRGAKDFSSMSNLARDFRSWLEENASLTRPKILTHQRSSDGTQKWVFSFGKGQEIETVFIPEYDRGALCISSQIGCTLNCSFCHTGTMPLVRNLKRAEIVGQIMAARDSLDEWQVGPATKPKKLSNIVLMGMGEPLYNYEEIKGAVRLALDQDGLNFSRRRITLSTSGVVPKIEQCGHDLKIGLAISLHAVRDELRNELVPINRKWNIETLLEACNAYPARRAITFEYVMLKGINDSDAEARELVRLLKTVPAAKVNLIPFNPWPGAPYSCSSNNRIRAFAKIVEDGGFASPVRQPRGQDIMAACGQLKTASIKKRASGRAA